MPPSFDGEPEVSPPALPVSGTIAVVVSRSCTPEPIDADPEDVMRAVVSTPPKKHDEKKHDEWRHLEGGDV